MTIIKREPVAFWGLLTTLIEAVIGLALVFGWIDWSAEQIGQVLVLVAAIGAVLVFFVRGKVSPVDEG